MMFQMELESIQLDDDDECRIAIDLGGSCVHMGCRVQSRDGHLLV